MRLPFQAIFVAMLALLASSLSGQTPHAQARITQAVQDAQRDSVPSTIPRRARLATDLGPAPADRRLTEVTLRFNLTPAQATALDELSSAQQDPASPRYHQWLTPEQYGAQFGLADADLAQVTAWLASQSLTVTSVSRGQTMLTVAGTVAQMQKAFGTTLHSLMLDGEQHFANLSDPTLPAPIAAVTGAITGLNDFRLKPRIQPRFTSAITGSHFIAPGDFYTLYDISPLLAGNITGNGLTIAVAGQTDIALTDVAAFRSASGLPANLPTVKLYGTDPGTSTADVPEASLDVEWSGAVAPAATILYVNSTDAIAGSLTNAVNNNLAPIITVSYGNCESGFGAANIAVYNQLFHQANVQGQTIVGPAGDSGATDCDFNVTSAVDGLAVDFPASSPFVTGLGGTMFAEGSGTYWSSTNSASNSSALSYIPETVWNETSSGANLAGGGGGLSAFFTKPSWQVGPGVPADDSRDVPDISFSAAAGHDGYLLCYSGFCTNGFRNAANNLQVVGGTSVSTPAFAGVLALLEQKIQSRVANANPTLYALANSTYSTAIFHDVTTGTNAEPCTAGSVNCPNGGTIGYAATKGYDLATGWGSVDTFNLVNGWSLVTPLAVTPGGVVTSATTLTSTSTSVTAGSSVLLTVNVTSATSAQTATPTGNVQLLVDNVTTGVPVALTNGKAAFTFSTTGLSAGFHILTAAYLGDATYLGSKGVFSNLDIVSASTPDFSLGSSTSTLTVASGAVSSGVTLTVTPANGFTGLVLFSASVVPSGVALSTSFSSPMLTISSTASGTSVFTLVASAPSTTARARDWKETWQLAGSGVALAGLIFLTLPRRRKRWHALLLFVVAAALLGVSGCGSSSGATSTASGMTKAAPGTYTLTITASSNNAAGAPLVHQTNLTLTIL